MYKLTDRIKKLKKEKSSYLRRKDIPSRDIIFNNVFKKHCEESYEKQFSYALKEFLENKAILIQPDDLLAGYVFHYSYNSSLPGDGPIDFDPSIKSYFHLDSQREIDEIIKVHNLLPDKDKEIIDALYKFKDDVDNKKIKHWHGGHFIADYEGLLQKGFIGILQEEKAKLNELEKALKQDANNQVLSGKKDIIESYIITTKACIGYINRYLQMCNNLIDIKQSNNISNISNLYAIRQSLEHILNGTPKSFLDALQLVWIAHEIAICESYPSAISFGRFDKYLLPFYTNDIENNVITKEEAFELVCAFWIKLSNCRKGYQNLTIGGCDETGKSIVNDLTFYALNASKLLKFDQPSLAFRCTEDMSDCVWNEIIDLISTGMGFPALFSDKNCIEAKSKVGIGKNELYDYAFIGCVEMSIPGKEYDETEIARINLPAMLNDYIEIIVKENIQYDSFEQFYSKYIEYLKSELFRIIKCINMADSMIGVKYPMPYLSTMIKGCIKNAKDVTSGGAIYNTSGINICGLATLVDSLTAIKDIIFENKLYSFEKFLELLKNNFANDKMIRLYVENICSKYGNDDDQVDELAVEIVNAFYEVIVKNKNARGGRFGLGLYTVEDHAVMGKQTMATPDGRLANKAFSNSMSASQGCDIKGPTALMNSVTKIDLTKASNGMVLDLRFTPTFIEKKEHKRALIDLIKTYFDKGGLEVQISVVSSETLKNAQSKPDEYKDLIVRVSGFSAYFVNLDRTTQDELIKRTELC